jgi:hypothetical protein
VILSRGPGKERASLIHRTELMDSGELQTYEDRNEPGAVDTTVESIERAKYQLAELDALLAMYPEVENLS